MPQVGELDGYGHYGMIDEDADGLLCHECGYRLTHLGLHVWKRHGMSADTYRELHGLGRRGLVAAATREKMAEKARITMPTKTKLLARRDPARAKAAQIEQRRGMSPAGQEAVRQMLRERNRDRARRERARKAVVVECEGCGARFCPLRGGRLPRFCSMSCSGRANRARRRS